MKILLLENHKHFSSAVVKEFLSHYDVTVLPSIAEAKQSISVENFDFILVDYDLDDGKGDEFLIHLKEIGKIITSIAISSHDIGNAALLKAGATCACSKMEFNKINQVLDAY